MLNIYDPRRSVVGDSFQKISFIHLGRFAYCILCRNLNCTYKQKPLFSESWERNLTNQHYYLKSINRQYVIPEDNITVSLQCHVCNECSIATGISPSNQFLYFLGIIGLFIVVLCVLFFGLQYLVHVILRKKRDFYVCF